MTILIITFAVLALLLGFLEIFILPGFGIAGIGSIICAIVGAVLIYNAYGLVWALLAVVVGLLLVFLALRWAAKSKVIDRMALHTAIESTAATPDQLSVKVGDRGEALTRLALVGNARIAGRQVEVKSSGEFLPAGTPVRVVSVVEAQIIVERDKD